MKVEERWGSASFTRSLAGVEPFAWIAARSVPVADPANEHDLVTARLLETMGRIAADRLPGP